MLCSSFWVMPRPLNPFFQCFGALCSIFMGRLNKKNVSFLIRRIKMGECFETSAQRIQTPGNHPKERIHHSHHYESTKSRK
jgi:hypothetical protein